MNETILKYFPDLSGRQLGQFGSLDALYREWNEKINVISRKDLDGLYERHVLHSLSIAAVYKFQAGQEVMDLGTGGGFPGIPLAILFPETSFHLVDSIAKKLKVVDAIARKIELNNVTTRHTRAEDIRDRKFDFVVTRAVAPLADLWKWSKPLLKHLGSPGPGLPAPDSRLPATGPMIPALSAALFCLKGGDLRAEINESGLNPVVIEISKLFTEAFFREKYVLVVAK